MILSEGCYASISGNIWKVPCLMVIPVRGLLHMMDCPNTPEVHNEGKHNGIGVPNYRTYVPMVYKNTSSVCDMNTITINRLLMLGRVAAR